MALLPELEPRYYTYIGFLCAFGGMIFIITAILAIFNLFGLGEFIPWPIPAAFAILSMLLATLSFHKMGDKKIPL